MVARIGGRIGVALFALALSAEAASANDGLFVQPLEGWLVGVLVILLISILGRHRPAKFGQDRTKHPVRSEH